MCEADLKNYERVNGELREKIEENGRLNRAVEELEQQGNEFLDKVGQK